MKRLTYFVILALFTGCYYDKFNELHPLNGNSNVCSPSTPANYTASVDLILRINCTSCHNSALANGGVNLDNYLKVKTEASNGRLIGTITHASGYKSMPPGTTIRQCEIDKIRSWVQSGMPE